MSTEISKQKKLISQSFILNFQFLSQQAAGRYVAS